MQTGRREGTKRVCFTNTAATSFTIPFDGEDENDDDDDIQSSTLRFATHSKPVHPSCGSTSTTVDDDDWNDDAEDDDAVYASSERDSFRRS